jgi:hypothetical protein
MQPTWKNPSKEPQSGKNVINVKASQGLTEIVLHADPKTGTGYTKKCTTVQASNYRMRMVTETASVAQ